MNKIVLEMKKPRAKDRIEVILDKDYDDLFHWRFINIKDGKLKRSHLLTAYDLPRWKSGHESYGWKEVVTS